MSAAVALAVAGLGGVVVMGRRLAAALGEPRVVAVDWEVELAADVAAADRREAMIRQVLEWAAEREERRRLAVERAAVGGG